VSKTLYISDLDGTLLNSNAELSDYTTDKLNALIADGLHFTVATARASQSTQKVLANLNLRLPIILMNGALIYNLEQQCYAKINTLSPEAALAIINILRQFDTTAFMYECNDGEFITYHEASKSQIMRDFIAERIASYQRRFRHIENFSNASYKHIIYFTLLDTHERLLPIYNALQVLSGLNCVLYHDTYRKGFWFLEIFSVDASKQTAADYLRETFGFERLIGFGDNLNDLPLFAACDVKVSVENAVAEVRAASDFVCDKNDRDGVVKWLLDI